MGWDKIEKFQNTLYGFWNFGLVKYIIAISLEWSVWQCWQMQGGGTSVLPGLPYNQPRD